MKDKRAIDVMKNNPSIKMPWSLARLFPGSSKNKRIDFSGDTASLGEDYCNIHEIREGLDWLVGQFGGKVKWEK